MNQQQIKRIESRAKEVFLKRQKDILKNLDAMEHGIYATNESLKIKGVPLAERKLLVNTERQSRIDSERIRIASVVFCLTCLHEMMFDSWELLNELDTFESNVDKVVWYRFDHLCL